MRPEAEKAIEEAAAAVDEAIMDYGRMPAAARLMILNATRIAAINAYMTGFEVGAKTTSEIYKEGMK